MTEKDEEAEWEKTRDIDNPLSPWVNLYKGEIALDFQDNVSYRPPLDMVVEKFRTAKLTAYIATAAFCLLFLVIWPVSMFSRDILDEYDFSVWTSISLAW